MLTRSKQKGGNKVKDQIKLSTLRMNKGLSQRDLADELNISAGIIGLYETGKRTPSLKNAKIIAEYFEVSLEDISFANK